MEKIISKDTALQEAQDELDKKTALLVAQLLWDLEELRGEGKVVIHLNWEGEWSSYSNQFLVVSKKNSIAAKFRWRYGRPTSRPKGSLLWDGKRWKDSMSPSYLSG